MALPREIYNESPRALCAPDAEVFSNAFILCREPRTVTSASAREKALKAIAVTSIALYDLFLDVPVIATKSIMPVTKNRRRWTRGGSQKKTFSWRCLACGRVVFKNV